MTELYRDEVIAIQTAENAAANGHLQVKANNIVSLDAATPDQASHLFLGASQVAVALFELVGAHGTNIILTENDQDLTVDVVARQENDGINPLWQPTQGNPQELQVTAKSIKDAVDILVWKQNNPDKADTQTPTETKTQEIKEETTETGEKKTNYLLKSLRRSP